MHLLIGLDEKEEEEVEKDDKRKEESAEMPHIQGAKILLQKM